METMVNCGHVAVSEGIGAGYGTTQDGYTLCYPCCNADEVARLPFVDVIGAYVREADRTITTWPGGQLGTVTDLWKRHMASYTRRYVHVRDVHGQHWTGVGSDAWDVVTLRKVSE